MADILVLGGLIGTQDESRRVIADGAIAIEGNRIVAVGPRSEIAATCSAPTIIDAGGKVVMPGFVCTHTHMASVLGHNMPADFSKMRDFMDKLTKWWWPKIEDQTTDDDIYYGSLYAATKMMKTGTTTIVDMVEAPFALPNCTDWGARAAQEVGIRAVFGFETTERINMENAEAGIEENLRFVKKWNNATDGLIRGRFAVHTAYTCSPKNLKRVRDLADETGAGIMVHVAEIPPALLVEKYGKTAPKVLEEVGFLGPDVLAIHCIHMTDEELDIFQKYDVKVSHTPMSNMRGGAGVAPVPGMLDRGITVSIGHDCFFTLDFITYARTAFLLHKVHRLDPRLIPPSQALDMATVNGAKALGMEDEIGSLEVGKKADIIIVDPDCPSPVNEKTFASYVMSDLSGADVETVIVDGRVTVENHKVLTVDEQYIHKKSLERARLLWERNGVL